MRKSNRLAAAMLAALFLMVTVPAFGQTDDGNSKANSSTATAEKQDETTPTVPVDGIEFIKQFKIGMTYAEVQAALPKSAEQDILSYVTSDQVFILNVDLPGAGDWSASFRFDTQDTAVRRPDHLVEMNCSASLSSRNQSFDGLVGKVNSAFGQPVQVDRSKDKIQLAGWRVGGSVLTLEYSIMPNGIGNNVTVEFTIRQNGRRKTAADDIA